MAYTIGSQKGKEIAQGLKAGETYKASDGSTWTKQSDGSVSVTHQGVTTSNAYKPTTSGSSSSGTSSGGSSSSGGRAVTNYNGATYKVNDDGKAPTGLNTGDKVVTSVGTYIIDGVNDDGTYVSSMYDKDTTTKNYAGAYMNGGSTTTGGSTASTTAGTTAGTTTTNYNTPVAGNNNIDYSTIILQRMAEGASWQEINGYYNERQKKALTTPGLEQYADDDIQRAAWNYIQQGIAADANPEQYMDDFQYDEEKPTYTGQYDGTMSRLLAKILNRDDFSYNPETDPIYQQYRAQYAREGDRAMRDTLAEVASGAGGMNSYAITAAQQANNNYMSMLGDKIPELYQLAYEMYLQDKESMVQDLGILQSLDATDYNRYRDTMSDYYSDKNFAYGVYQDAVTQGNWEKNFSYNQVVNDRDWTSNMAQNTVNNQHWEQEWNNTLEQQEIQNERYDKEWARDEERYQTDLGLMTRQEAEERAVALLDMGEMPPDNVLEAAGMDRAYATAYLTGVKNQQAAKTSSGGSGGGGGGDNSVYDDEEDDDTKSTSVIDGLKKSPSLGMATGAVGDLITPIYEMSGKSDIVPSGAHSLGLGSIDDATYMSLVARGAVEEYDDGSVKWADGWSAQRWKDTVKNGIKVVGSPF